MGALATVFSLLTLAAPSDRAADREARLLVAPIAGLGLTSAVSDQVRARLRNALRAAGARVITDRGLTVACSTDAACARRKAGEAEADGLVAVTALRVGATVQLTFRAVAASTTGDMLIDESLAFDVEGFPARGIFDPLVRRLLGILAPSDVADAVTDEPSSAALSSAAPPTTVESSYLGWIGLGASAACVVGGVTLLLVARADIARVEDARPGTSWREVEVAYDRAPALSGVGWALTGIGAVGGIASLLWLPLGDARVAVGAGPSFSGIAVAGKL